LLLFVDDVRVDRPALLAVIGRLLAVIGLPLLLVIGLSPGCCGPEGATWEYYTVLIIIIPAARAEGPMGAEL
jgi:hypothetical protein